MSKATPKTDSTFTSIDDAPDTALEQASAEPVASLAVADNHGAFDGERAELVINSEPGVAGSQAVFVGINGHGFNIPRNTKVIVPKEVIDQLDNATQTVYEQLEGGKSRETQVKRFAYSVRFLAPGK